MKQYILNSGPKRNIWNRIIKHTHKKTKKTHTKILSNLDFN